MNDKSGLPEGWDRLTPEQKREYRFNRWADSENDIKFVSPEAKKHYAKKLKRIRDVYSVREPDQVPVSVNAGVLPFYFDGMDYKTALHDLEKAGQACIKFNAKYGAELDSYAVPIALIPAEAFEGLNNKLNSWPGYGLPANGTVMQFVEGEYMRADEYDVFIKNPSDFWMRTYLPRAFGAFEPFKKLSSFTDIIEYPTSQFMPLTMPDVQKVLRQLLEAGEALNKYSRGYLKGYAGHHEGYVPAASETAESAGCDG